MEAISSIQELDLFAKDFDYKSYLQQKQEQLRKNQRFEQFVQENPILKNEILLDRLLKNECTTLIECFTNEAKCKSCQGLSSCSSIHGRGKQENFKVDAVGELIYELKPCLYAQEEQKKREYLNLFMLSDRDSKDYLTTLDSVTDSHPLKLGNQYKKACMELIMSFAEDKQGLLLYGDIGVGKTYLCQAAANDYARQGYTVGFMQVQNLVESVKQEFDKPNIKGRTLKLACTVDVLFLDDLGAEMMTEYNRDAILMKILDSRCLGNKKTYITTNLDQSGYTQESIVKHYANTNRDGVILSELPGARLADRIRALTNPVCIQGSSARGL